MNAFITCRNTARHAIGGVVWLFATLPGVVPGQTYKVVNMIPAKWSAETLQNSEPTIGAHPTVTSFLAATAFTSGASPCKSSAGAPIFVSTDEGDTWGLSCVIPTQFSPWPMDMTVGFSGDGTALYIGSLDFDDAGPRLIANVFGLRKPPRPRRPKLLTSGSIITGFQTLLFTRTSTDQPQVATPPTGGLMVSVVGANRGTPDSPADSCLDLFVWSSQDPWNAPESPKCLADNRPLVGVGSVPAVRVAPHSDGTTYAILYRPVIDGSRFDVVVYRHDPSTPGFGFPPDTPATGSGPASGSLSDCDRHDGLAGSRVVRCVYYYPPSGAFAGDFGQERRVGTELSVAIDPQNSKTVYIAWAERSPTNDEHLALHFAHSEDGGENWIFSPWSVDHATNPALAVASDGAVGILYEQLEGTAPEDHWITHLAISTDRLGSTPASDQWLAKVLAHQPAIQTPPYLGDYIRLVARDRNFYGVFPASNDLSTGIFFNLTSHRFYDGTGHPKTRKGAPVGISIDPYFFKVIR